MTLNVHYKILIKISDTRKKALKFNRKADFVLIYIFTGTFIDYPSSKRIYCL